MGYDIHITRQENWFDEDPDKMITLEEWKQLLADDPEMRIDNFAEATTTAGESIRMESEGIAVWTKYSGNGINGNFAWFHYSNGNISCKNPDSKILTKMLTIADRLKAKVQGDEGECYDSTTTELKTQENSSPIKEKPWWKFW